MQFTSSFSIIAAACALSACAAAGPADHTTGLTPGAHHAWIVELYPDATSHDELPACLSALPAGALSTRHFAKLRYRHVRRMYTEVAEIPPGADLAVDDEVELFPQDCGQGELSRIGRVIATSPRHLSRSPE